MTTTVPHRTEREASKQASTLSKGGASNSSKHYYLSTTAQQRAALGVNTQYTAAAAALHCS